MILLCSCFIRVVRLAPDLSSNLDAENYLYVHSLSSYLVIYFTHRLYTMSYSFCTFCGVSFIIK